MVNELITKIYNAKKDEELGIPPVLVVKSYLNPPSIIIKDDEVTFAHIYLDTAEELIQALQDTIKFIRSKEVKNG